MAHVAPAVTAARSRKSSRLYAPIPSGRPPSDSPAVVPPVQPRLPLPPPALQIAGLAVFSYRGNVTRDRAPASDLTHVIRRAPAHVIAAVPLKPAARILRANPAVAPPHRERL